MNGPWTREAVQALGPTTDVPTTAEIFGVNPETVYSAIRRAEWTATRVLRLGRVIRIPTLDLINLLFGPEQDTAPAPAPVPAVPSPCHHRDSVQVTAAAPQSQCGCNVGSTGVVRPTKGA